MSDNPYPFPPKTSMFWRNHHYTYEEATEAWGRDGDLASLNHEITSPETSSVHPPENSMFWEGHTGETELPAVPDTEPKVLNLTPQKKVEARDVHFVPVRYAVDQLESPFGLPENWLSDHPRERRFKKVTYTLRQLRDGWLYIYNHTTQSLDEFQAEGTLFTHYKLADENPEQDARGIAQPSRTYITVPEGSQLTLCFSTHRWSWTKFLQVCKRPQLFTGFGMNVCVKEVDTPMHFGPIECLGEVADIESSVVEDKRFNDSYVATSPDEQKSKSTTEQIIKPVAAIDSITASLPKDEQAFVVALYDYVADCHDIAGRCVYHATPYRVYQEEKGPQWTLLQAVMRMCLFGDMDGLRFPPSVRTRDQRFEFYADIVDYYDKRDLVKTVEKGVATSAIEMADPTAINVADTMESNTARAIEEKYNLSPSVVGRYEQWAANSKWRSSIDWSALKADMDEIVKQSKSLMSEAQQGMHDLRTQLKLVNHSVLSSQFDLWGESSQVELHTLHKSLVEAYTFVMSEEDEAWLVNEFTDPKTLIVLNIAGFNREVYSSLKTLLQVNELEKSDFAAKTGDWGKAQGLYGAFIDFSTNPDVNDTQILKALAAGINKLDQVLMASGKALAALTTRWAVSPVAWSVALIMPALTKAPTANGNLLMTAMAERLAHGFALTVPENYAQNIRDWQTKRDALDEKLAKAEEKAKRHRSGPEHRKAWDRVEQLRRSKAVHKTRLPDKLVFPDDIRTAVTNAYADIIKGKVDNLQEHFNSVGGIGFLAMVINLVAVNEALSDAGQTGTMSDDEALVLGQTLATTAAAWSGIRLGPAWEKIAQDSKLHKHSVNGLIVGLERRKIDTNLTYLKNTQYFTKWLGITAGFGLMAAGFELWSGARAMDGLYGTERSLKFAQNATVFATGAVSLVQFLGSATGQLSIRLMFGAVAMSTLLITGVLSIFIGAALEKVKKDDYQKWLAKLPWGRDPARRQWSDSTEENATLVMEVLEVLDWLIQQPAVYQQPVEQRVPNTSSLTNYDQTKMILTDTQVTISLPASHAKAGLTLATNTDAEAEQLLAGTWSEDTKTNRYCYSVTLPLREPEDAEGYRYQAAAPQDSNSRYLLLKMDYLAGHNGEDGQSAHEYLCYHLARTKAAYTTMKDKNRLEKLKKITLGEAVTLVAPTHNER